MQTQCVSQDPTPPKALPHSPSTRVVCGTMTRSFVALPGTLLLLTPLLMPLLLLRRVRWGACMTDTHTHTATCRSATPPARPQMAPLRPNPDVTPLCRPPRCLVLLVAIILRQAAAPSQLQQQCAQRAASQPVSSPAAAPPLGCRAAAPVPPQPASSCHPGTGSRATACALRPVPHGHHPASATPRPTAHAPPSGRGSRAARRHGRVRGPAAGRRCPGATTLSGCCCSLAGWVGTCCGCGCCRPCLPGSCSAAAAASGGCCP